MRRIIPVALVSLFVMGACSKDAPKGSAEKCKAARSEAASKWEETEKAWLRIHDSWSAKDLTSRVETALKAKIGAGEEGPGKVAKEMVTFKDYLAFKIQKAQMVRNRIQATLEALKDKPEKALKMAGRARRAARDPSVTGTNKAAWFTLPAVSDIDEAQDKALGHATEAMILTEKAEEVCKK